MGTTPRGYPYPAGSDNNDVVANILALATAIDTDMTASAGVAALDRVHATVTVVNSAAETDLYRKTIAGGTLGTDGGLRLRVSGDLLSNAGVGTTYRFRLKYGATTILDTGVNEHLIVNGTSRLPFVINVLLVADGTGNQRCDGALHHSDSVSVAVPSWHVGGSGGALFHSTGYGVATEDSTAAKDLALTVQMSGASATADIRRQMALLEKVAHS